MTEQEIESALSEQIVYFPCTGEFLHEIKDVAVNECKIEILEQHRVSSKLVILKMIVPTAQSLFQLGAFVQINRTHPIAAEVLKDILKNS